MTNAEPGLLLEENTRLKKEVERLKTELGLTVKVNEELAKRFEKASIQLPVQQSKIEKSAEQFEVDAELYGFRRPAIMHRGQKLTASEVLASVELQKELIKINSGMIYKVTSA